jgi:catechol 2,3-dioxygenase-like lactoylglutathione lyase family enzyme
MLGGYLYDKSFIMLGKYDLMAFVSTTEPDKARAFYEGKLGLAVTHQDNFGITYDAHGIRLRMSIVRELKPAPYSILSWVVPDIHAVIGELAAKGVLFEIFGGFEQDAAGVWTAPDGTQVAWFKDPGGNMLSLTEWARA